MSSPASGQERARHSCPSYFCTVGARLLGVVRRDGTVAFISPQPRVDAEFVHAAQAGRAPELRFRFAGPCVESACMHWRDGRCSLIDRLADEVVPSTEPSSAAAHCSIAATCRWRAQIGSDACAICPEVVRGPTVGDGASTSDVPAPCEVVSGS